MPLLLEGHGCVQSMQYIIGDIALSKLHLYARIIFFARLIRIKRCISVQNPFFRINTFRSKFISIEIYMDRNIFRSKYFSIKIYFYRNIFLYIQNRGFNSFMLKINQESSRVNEEFFKGNKKKIKFLLKLEFY